MSERSDFAMELTWMAWLDGYDWAAHVSEGCSVADDGVWFDSLKHCVVAAHEAYALLPTSIGGNSDSRPDLDSVKAEIEAWIPIPADGRNNGQSF